MLWVSFSFANFIGIIILSLIYSINHDASPLQSFLNDDGYSITFLLTTPSLIGLLLYLVANDYWKKAYIVYIASNIIAVGLPIVFFGLCAASECGGIGEAVFPAIGIALAFLVVYFAKNMADSRGKFLTATIMGVVYLAMYSYVGFSL